MSRQCQDTGEAVVAVMHAEADGKRRPGPHDGGRGRVPQAANRCFKWPDAIVCEMAILMLKVEHDAKQIATKAGHLVETRRYPRDCLRNAELLEEYAAQLQTHARQIVRRALENQP